MFRSVDAFKDMLVSLEMKDGAVYQGRIHKVKPGESPSIVLRKPFKNGMPASEDVLELASTDICTAKLIEQAEEANADPAKDKPKRKPRKAQKKKPNELSKPEEVPKPAQKVVVLKRGSNENDHGLAAEMSSSCVVSEGKPKKSNSAKINVEMIPAAVLNGRKADKSIIDKLVPQTPLASAPSTTEKSQSPQQQPQQAAHQQQQPAQLVSLFEQARKADQSKRIDVQDLLNATNPTAQSPTKQPVFKKYGDFKQFTEPQTPEPRLVANAQKQPKRAKGPSGNPTADQQNGYKMRGKCRELASSLNMDELNEDFDFTGNLALFDKDRSNSGTPDSRPVDEVERPASKRNFRHDENIVDDPTRCTSWVNTSHQKQLVHLNHAPHSIDQAADEFGLKLVGKQEVNTENGAVLPVLHKSDKEKYLKATIRLFNHVIYNVTVADRFVHYALEVQARHALQPDQIVVAAGEDCSDVLLHRVCQQLRNRQHALLLYQPPKVPGPLLDTVQVVRDAAHLPDRPQLVHLLNRDLFFRDEPFRRWLNRVARPPPEGRQRARDAAARVVGLDLRVFDLSFMHTLFLGAADETGLPAKRHQAQTGANALFEGAVADLGTPYHWIQSAKSDPAHAFQSTFVVRLQNVA